MNFGNTCVTIDLDAIRGNFHAVAEKAGVPVMAVVKADAYGHGAVPVARALEADCGFFAVAMLSEALQLRQAGIKKPILILGHTPLKALPLAVKNRIRPAIYRWEDAVALSEAAQEQGVTAPFHFALDTGMSRIGFQATEEEANLCRKIAALPGLEAEGIFSHFARADEEDLTSARKQAALFEAFCRRLSDGGLEIPIRHMDNSAGIIRFSDHYSMVRAGIALYGLAPSPQTDTSALKLKPAMSWHSRICHVKWLEPGRQIGYGGTFTVAKPTRVATVCTGYADGYRRNLSGKFYVLIRGKEAPILGRICMDQMMVDVTEIPDAAVDDPVVLMGEDGEKVISAEVLAAACDSFPYELISNVGHRCLRQYYEKGCLKETVDYLL